MNDLRARVLADVAKNPSPTRAQYTQRLLIIAVVGALATASLFFAMGGFDQGARPTELVAFTTGMALISAIVLTRLSSGHPGSMVGRPRVVLITAAVLGAPVLALGVLVATMCFPAATAPASEGMHLGCAAMTLVQGALPLAALIVPRRGTDPVHPIVSGAALGMTAGAWTAMMAFLRCSHGGSLHCILAHVVPTLVLTAIGALLGWLLLRVRAR